jgi:[ribosomal protein S5]-alanine N-acetyltransferase
MKIAVFDRFPLLSTPRLLLREPLPSDAEALFALRSDEEVNRFQLQDALADVRAAAAQIARWRKRFSLKAEIRWVIASRDDGVLLGTCAFTHFVPWLDRGHVSYEIARLAWGRGLATEALGAMAAFGHGEAGLNRIEAVVLPGNEASARVLLRAGFEEEGLLRAYGLWNGVYHDMRMFSKAREGHVGEIRG